MDVPVGKVSHLRLKLLFLRRPRIKHILQSRLAVDDEARPLSEIGQDDRGVNDETEGQLACGLVAQICLD